MQIKLERIKGTKGRGRWRLELDRLTVEGPWEELLSIGRKWTEAKSGRERVIVLELAKAWKLGVIYPTTSKPKEPDYVDALVDAVLALNPNCNEIGLGMLAHLQSLAKAIKESK